MTQITKEAIEAACAATVLGEDENYKPVHLEPREARIALEAALPFLSPIAGEGRAPEGWQLVPKVPTEAMLDVYWRQAGESKEMRIRTHHHSRHRYDELLAAAPVQPSSPGKDGGQEVEAVKPSIDTMREAAWALLRKFGWQPTARLSLHQVSEVMAAFGMNVSRGEVGCGYPDCGCCADAACEDAIKQHADFRPQPASTALVESEDYFGRLVADARVSAVKAKRKFPQPNYVTLKIAEEAGEVVRGAVHYAENRMSWEEVEGEIIQLLAMLIRFVTEGDEINGVRPPALSASTSREGER